MFDDVGLRYEDLKLLTYNKAICKFTRKLWLHI